MKDNEKETGLAWLKKHADTMVILGSFALAFWTLNEKISIIEKDMFIVKTVLIMRNMMPTELANQCEEEKK